MPLYGDGMNVRDWIFVVDNSRAIDLVFFKGKIGEIYNIGAGNEITNKYLTSGILDIMGKPKSLIKYVEDRPGHDRRYSLTIDKLKGLGWKPLYTFETAMEETVRWYLENREWWQKIKNKTQDYKEYYKNNMQSDKKIVVTGSSGMLGVDLCQELAQKYKVIGFDASVPPCEIKGDFEFFKIDLIHDEQTAEKIKEISPEYVIHLAAYTDVDGCELNLEKAYLYNTEITKYIAAACRKEKLVWFLSAPILFLTEKKDSPIKKAIKQILSRYTAGLNWKRSSISNELAGIFIFSGAPGFLENTAEISREPSRRKPGEERI